VGAGLGCCLDTLSHLSHEFAFDILYTRRTCLNLNRLLRLHRTLFLTVLLFFPCLSVKPAQRSVRERARHSTQYTKNMGNHNMCMRTARRTLGRMGSSWCHQFALQTE
jgi:hypothetical protein